MRIWLAAAVLCVAATARAQGLDVVGVGARAIGHAGTGVVSADDHAALWYNPAGLARRGEIRGQIGLGLVDQSLQYRSNHAFVSDPAEVVDRAGAELVPWAGAQAGIGDHVVVGLGYLAPTAISFRTPEPANYGTPADGDDYRYPHRHAATRFQLLRRGVGGGVAVRILPWLAAGVSGLLFDVQLSERRTLHGGYAPLDTNFRDQNGDQEIAAAGRDRLVPAASFGIVAAPEDTPIELGAAVLWCDDADLTGPVALLDTRGRLTEPPDPYANGYTAPDAEASLTVPFPLVARAGARFLSSWLTVEIGGEVGRFERRDLVWSLLGVDTTCMNGTERTDPCPTTVPITSLPVATRWRTGYALRASAETTVLDGFLTFSAGYAFARGIVPKQSLSTAFPDLDSHTVAVGVEARIEGATLSLGAARTERVAETVRPEATEISLVAPFREGNFAVGGGRYDGAATLVGLGVEVTY